MTDWVLSRQVKELTNRALDGRKVRIYRYFVNVLDGGQMSASTAAHAHCLGNSTLLGRNTSPANGFAFCSNRGASSNGSRFVVTEACNPTALKFRAKHLITQVSKGPNLSSKGMLHRMHDARYALFLTLSFFPPPWTSLHCPRYLCRVAQVHRMRQQ